MTEVNKKTPKAGKAMNDRPISFRASHALERRIDAAARELRIEKSEFIRHAVVRMLNDIPRILKERAHSSDHSQLLPESGALFSKINPSPEELLSWLRSDTEYAFTLTELEKRVAKLEGRSHPK